VATSNLSLLGSSSCGDGAGARGAINPVEDQIGAALCDPHLVGDGKHIDFQLGPDSCLVLRLSC
jgi:hypothetical protein